MGESRLEYDDAASARERMDVVHEVPERSDDEATRAWVESRQRLNIITDGLARRLIALHEACGSGGGECDAADDDETHLRGRDWPCETTRLIAQHYGVEHP